MNKANVVPEVPAHTTDNREELKLDAKGQSSVVPLETMPDARREPRFKIGIDITINSPTRGLLKGHTVDISQSGIAAILPIETPLDENVELNFMLPGGAVKTYAIVRQKRAFRYVSSS